MHISEYEELISYPNSFSISVNSVLIMAIQLKSSDQPNIFAWHLPKSIHITQGAFAHYKHTKFKPIEAAKFGLPSWILVCKLSSLVSCLATLFKVQVWTLVKCSVISAIRLGRFVGFSQIFFTHFNNNKNLEHISNDLDSGVLIWLTDQSPIPTSKNKLFFNPNQD